MKEKEKNFYHNGQELLENEVEVITSQGNFSGKLLELGKDVIIIESRIGQRPTRLIIRLDEVVAIYRVDPFPRGPFDFFGGPGPEFEQEEHGESNRN